MTLVIAPRIRAKLAAKNPPVATDEIIQCFANRNGVFLYDDREEHKTEPPTKWFVAETDYGRKLKIVFIQDGVNVIIKTAYTPGRDVIRLYKRVIRQ